MTDPDLDVAARLAEVTANLDAYIEAKATEIAAARLAAVEEGAERTLAEMRAEHATEMQRSEDLIAELRRQLKPLARHMEDCMESRAERARQAEAGGDGQLLVEAARQVIDEQRVDQNWIQRHVRVGFATAGRLLTLLEEHGVIGPVPATRSGQRQVLVPKDRRDAELERLRAVVEGGDDDA